MWEKSHTKMVQKERCAPLLNWSTGPVKIKQNELMEKLYVRRKEKDWRAVQLYFFVYSTDTAAYIAAVIP